MDATFLDFKIIDLQEPASLLTKLEGNADKGIFICFSKEEIEHEAFLSKILSAIKLDLQTDVLILKETLDKGFSFSQIQAQKEIKITLIFGYSPKHLGIHANCQKYQPLTIHSCTFLFADKLAEIANDKKLKTLLWQALQSIFLKPKKGE